MTDDTKLQLHFGRDTYPDDVRAVWGARLIWPNDLVHDRQDLAARDDDAKMALIAWLNDEGILRKVLDHLGSSNCRFEMGLFGPKDNTEVVIYEDAKGKIIGSPQSSHGYLYVCGWLKEHVG